MGCSSSSLGFNHVPDGMEHVKRVALPGKRAALVLTQPLHPLTYMYEENKSVRKLHEVPVQEWVPQGSDVYIDIGANDYGERVWLSLAEVVVRLSLKDPAPLVPVHEHVVTSQRDAVQWKAVYPYENACYPFNVIEALSVRGHSLLLSNADALTADAPRKSSMLSNVALVVNCADSKPPEYWFSPKRVKCMPLHILARSMPVDGLNARLYKTNEQIWEALATGDVVVHCLAGLHRAACLVVTHFLYRSIALGHQYLSSDIAAIYDQLASVRPGVEPLSYFPVAMSFRQWLDKRQSTDGLESVRIVCTKPIRKDGVVILNTDTVTKDAQTKAGMSFNASVKQFKSPPMEPFKSSPMASTNSGGCDQLSTGDTAGGV